MPVDGTTASLLDTGFQRYDLAGELGVDPLDHRFTALATEFEELPPDPYGHTSGRHRRYGQGVLLPWTGEFRWMPDSDVRTGAAEYFQGEYNPEFAGQVRAIPALTAAAQRNPLLAEIIRFDFARTTWSAADTRWPLHVGVHFVKLVAADGREAVSSPDELHQDGEPYTFAHLVFRRNVAGGRNVIAEPKCRGAQPEDVPDGLVFAEFELSRPLDSYGVADHKVSHYVAPIRQLSGSAAAERAIMLVDFTVLTQRF